MSTQFYNKLLHETHTELDEIILEKELPSERSIKAEKARRNFNSLATMYIQYVDIMRRLDLCYDQIAHPQKRLVIRRLLDGTIGRILELKHNIVAIEHSDILCFDGVLTELHLTHEALEITIPRYFIQDRAEELKSRDTTIDDILTKYGLMEKSDDGFVSSTEDAILLIQRMERARQGKLRAHFMREIYERHQMEKARGTGGGRSKEQLEEQQQQLDEEPTIDPHEAALKIQQIWKGYTTMKKIRQEREEEMIFLGMIPPPISTDLKHDQKVRLREVEKHRRQLRLHVEKSYQDALVDIRQDILHSEGYAIMDSLQTEIRNWFFTYKDRTGKFPDYPTDDQGGFESILTRGTELDDEPKQKTKSNKRSPKRSSPTRTPSGSKRSGESGSGGSVRPQQSHFLKDIVTASSEYRDFWKGKTENGGEETYDVQIIREDKRSEVTRELRTQVDALMRQELEQLKIALLRDKGKKTKQIQAALRKEQRKFKKKQKNVKKKRKEKDLTAHRTMESLLEELVKEGIIKKYPQVSVKSFLGEPNYLPLNPTKKRDFIATTFSPADVRRFVTEYCILPLGCKDVHDRVPLTNSVLLVGPARTGKTMLVNAVCSETGATLFDLTATNLVGKYLGREGVKILLHLVSKMGRLLQPSVILVDDADKMFIKKIPKTDKTDPKRIKKGLQKLIRSLNNEDRILVLGTCQTPFEADVKALGSMYNKICCISRPDHASRFVLWRQLIQARSGHFKNSRDISTLTKVSDGYSCGSIAMAIAQVLTPHRIALQRRRVLQALEFIPQLAKFTPVFKEEEEAMKAWYLRTPLVRRKITSLQPEEKRSSRDKKKNKAKDDEKKKKKEQKSKRKK